MNTFKGLKQYFLLILLAIANCSLSFAQGSGTENDPYIMEDGGEYAFKMYNDFYGQFIVPEDVSTDGVVLEVIADNWTDIYADKEMTELVSVTTGNFAPYTSTVSIKKGTKKGTIFYVYSNFPLNSGSAKVSFGGGTPLKLSNVSPVQGSEISAGESYIFLEFTKPIRFESCKMIAGKVQKDVVANATDRFVSIEAKAELMDCYQSGELKQGDNILFIFSNVTSYDGKSALGSVVLNYKAAPRPLVLVSTVNTPETGMPNIKSWMSKNEEEGLIHLTFDGELNKEANITATLSYGDFEAEEPGEYYTESLTPTFTDLNTLTIDLRGKLRIPSQMVTSGKNYGEMLLTIRGIEDKYGYASYTENSASAGGYFLTYGFEVINYSLMTEFMPTSGQNIDNINEITIWMHETGANMTFTGATFEYVHNGENKKVVVDSSNIKVEQDEEDEAAHYIIIPTPSFSRDANSQVKFYLNVENFPDGMDHAAYITATFVTNGYEVPTGIESISQSLRKQIYTLDGKKVKHPQKHNIYIINGKKTLVK